MCLFFNKYFLYNFTLKIILLDNWYTEKYFDHFNGQSKF